MLAKCRVHDNIRAALCPLLIVLGLSACSEDVTQLLVLVNSDLSVRDELTAVRAFIRDENDKVLGTHSFELSETEAKQVSGQFVLPLSFGILPRDGDADLSVVIDVEAVGTSTDRVALFTRRSITRFVAEKSLLLPMFLARQCTSLVCPSGQTCTEEGCVTPNIEPTTLREVEFGETVEFNWHGAS